MSIDGLTGFTTSRYQFLERVEIAAAALTTSQGDNALKPTYMVAVPSEICLVIIGYIVITNLRVSLSSGPRTI